MMATVAFNELSEIYWIEMNLIPFQRDLCNGFLI